MATNEFKLITFTVLIIVITLGLTNAQWRYDDTGCRTPDGGVGDCLIIGECKSMLDFLEKIISINQELYDIIRSYQCGVQGKSVKVCCPEEPIPIPVSGENNEETPIQVIPTTSSISSPPDITNHRNIQLLPSALYCGPLPSDQRITNGNKTDLGEFPWMVLLSYQTQTGQDFRCGGTLINDRYVLTAAHCITHLNNLKLIGVRLGDYNISSEQDCQMLDKNTVNCADPVQDIVIEELIPHPNYSYATYINDIGLVRLSSPAKFKRGVQPICLPIDDSLRNKNFTTCKLIVTGWGLTGENTGRSDDLLKVEVPVIPETECQIVYNKTSAVLNHKQLCAGGKNNRDSCGGDSGGPLQLPVVIDNDLNFVQFGIVSFGPRSCGLENFPSVYTRIDYYLDWILDNIRA